ncbi:ANL_HP_G0152630.mRNA.1.CDS.1 [Saccharomyces cerevisiae]|nr:ANL_HP_G0152630.mRNA.1.CDS.1 [Saccharomyces cerevisiae]CAI7012166.1 ANL_HP_G0152630.mRNA.1.CDS.1 [Saccharomyces cerevisiae]
MYCRPAPSDFSENQRQIFCVFSGKGVHKLRHYLVNLTSPAFGPHADVNDVLTKYIRSKNLIFNGETLEDALRSRERLTMTKNIVATRRLNHQGLRTIFFPEYHSW